MAPTKNINDFFFYLSESILASLVFYSIFFFPLGLLYNFILFRSLWLRVVCPNSTFGSYNATKMSLALYLVTALLISFITVAISESTRKKMIKPYAFVIMFICILIILPYIAMLSTIPVLPDHPKYINATVEDVCEVIEKTWE
jgi:hypothetical protein